MCRRGLQDGCLLAQQDLSGNAISDISPIQSMDYLLTLNLKGNRLRDIPSVLETRKYLQIVNLAENRIAATDSVRRLPQVTNLNLNGMEK